MRRLIEGIHQFQTGVFGPQRELFARLAHGQNPEALFITCSDSRIEPNLMTQTKPGDLFILRNAGNLIPAWGLTSGEAATIEYAVEALGISDIVVCGHTRCGAMDAVLHPEKLAELPAVRDWLRFAEPTRRILARHYRDVSDPTERLEICVEENVLAQIENLRTHPAVLAALCQRQLTIHAWVYDIESGGVFAYSDEAGQFLPVVEAGHGRSRGQVSAAENI